MIADDLSRIAMSPGLGATLARAVERARSQGHLEVTLEHMLLALCEDADAALVLAASNIDVAQITAGASGYLDRRQPHAPPGRMGDPAVSPDLRRILEAAAAAARGGRRREINGAIVLAAIVGDGKSAAAQLLQAQGMTFEGAIRALQRAPAAAGRPQPGTDTEQILASARERVQSRSIHTPRKLATAAPAEDDETDRASEPAPEEIAPEVAAQPAPEREPQETLEKPPVPQPARVEAASRKPEPAAATAPEPEPEPEEDAPATKEEPREPPPKLAHRLESLQPPRKPRSDRSVMSTSTFAPPKIDVPAPTPPAPSQTAAPPAKPAPDRAPAPPPSNRGAAPPPVLPPPIPTHARGAGWGTAPSGQPPAPPSAEPMPQRPPAPGRMRPPPPPQPPPLPGADAARPAVPPMERRPGDAVGSGQLGTLAAKRRAAPPGAGTAPQPAGGARPAPRAELGQLVENIPRTMRVAVPRVIEVRVARAEVRALAQGLQGGGAAYQHEVTVTKAMSVRLRAPDGGFYIETASPETQWIEKSMLMGADEYASWRWHVTPRERGKKRLQLIISARTVGADGLAAETALPDQVITVKVRTNYGLVFGRWSGWVVAALVGGLLARFGEGVFDAGQSIIAKLMAG